jgi:GNAT superfamily N-acetyltransferase
MTSPNQLRGKSVPPEAMTVRESSVSAPALNRFFYEQVGGPWQWLEKLNWTVKQWEDYVCRPQLRTWIGYQGGMPVGYYELEKQPDGSVKIAYFGLLQQFIGQGMGGALLTHAIESAWAWGATRVWVHTCTKDHPAALPNYQGRGMTIFKQQRL